MVFGPAASVEFSGVFARNKRVDKDVGLHLFVQGMALVNHADFFSEQVTVYRLVQ